MLRGKGRTEAMGVPLEEGETGSDSSDSRKKNTDVHPESSVLSRYCKSCSWECVLVWRSNKLVTGLGVLRLCPTVAAAISTSNPMTPRGIQQVQKMDTAKVFFYIVTTATVTYGEALQI